MSAEQAGEWRTLGLFAADDADRFQQTLASMPLKIWRTDQVTPLAPHPNDPGPSTRPGQAGAEFLTTFTVTIPDGTPRQAVEGAGAGEAARTRAGWPGTPRASVDTARSGTRSRRIPGQGQRADGSHREVAAARPVDDDGDHAAHASAPASSTDTGSDAGRSWRILSTSSRRRTRTSSRSRATSPSRPPPTES